MHYSLGVVMDPIAAIKPHKDTSFAMMLEAQRRGAELLYFELGDLYIDNGKAMGVARPVSVTDTDKDFYSLGEARHVELGSVDVLLMRKDPPFDSQFLYATHILSLAKDDGALVVNHPRALRDFNEKLFTSYFPEHIPDTLVTSKASLVREFHARHKNVICKPLDGMGGASIFHVREDGANLGVIIETLTDHGKRFMMVQRYLPEIKDGDKRVLIVDGEVVPYCLARLPSKGESRGNLAAGGTGRPQPASDSDIALAQAIAPMLKAHDILFVGLDVIGDKITEINITSPTCVREIEAQYDINIMAILFDAIERRLATRSASPAGPQ
ncbi:glutathione synthase [Alteromonas sp. CYL-A6]|uniref:glutathione synthase n=1 Tax=Alteromonas nitratireducens TaxID=3390813 RepID=UPI0034BE407F